MRANTGAVLAAAGQSSRMGTGERSKVLLPLGEMPVLGWSLAALRQCEFIGEIVIVCRQQDRQEILALAQDCPIPVKAVIGGADRQESVARGAAAFEGDWEYILVHDAARPGLTPELARRVWADAAEHGAATAALPMKDTVKLAGEGAPFVERTLPRERLFAIQTPQVFRFELYRQALASAGPDARYTDDCQLLEAAGFPVALTPGEEGNLKLTTPADLALLERGKEERAVRVGHGYDVHRLAEGRKLILGGVEIPFEKGLLGHSDADVLTHALCDAILGAAALGDIGHLFPDSDPRFQGADSLDLLRKVCAYAQLSGWVLENADCTLLAQRPKIAPYVEQMRQNLAAACGVEIGRISVKATTEEGLGFTGSGQGMAAHAVVLVKAG